MISFDEARKSGKKIKHVNMDEYAALSHVMVDLAWQVEDKEINRLLDEDVWEIEE